MTELELLRTDPKHYSSLYRQHRVLVLFVKYNSTLDKYVLEAEVNDLRVLENLLNYKKQAKK
jgi:hypothetical protein